MAKKKAQRCDVWRGEDIDDALDGVFRTLGSQAALDLNRTDISVGSDDEKLLIGLPLPALSLRYLFQSTVFPLSRITQITGSEGSCKSALGYEIMKWHLQNGGGGVLLENESKDSPELRKSILEWNLRWLNRVEMMPTRPLEQWMAGLSTFLRLAASLQDDPTGPGRAIPIAFMIDSITATLPESVLEKLRKTGHASLGYPVGPRLIDDYMRSMPDWLQNYPFSIIGTNHLKVGQDQLGRTTYNVPGGASVKFMETFEIQMMRTHSPDIDLLEYGGIRVRLKTEKNSLGPSRKQIVAELLWWQEDIDGSLRQMTRWDWYTSSVELLLAFNETRTDFGIKSRKTVFKRLMDICHIVVTNKSRREAKCRDLGFDEPVSFREIGIALEQRPDILEAMYPLLGITSRALFEPGLSYQAMRAELANRQQAANGPATRVVSPDVDALDPLQAAGPEYEDDDDDSGVA